MNRLLLLVSFFSVVASERRAVTLVEVTKAGEVVLPRETSHAVEEIVPKGTEVVVVGGWGFGEGADLAMLFNTFASCEEDGGVASEYTLAEGFAFPTQPQPPAVWLMNSGKKTADGKQILLMPCFFCDDADREELVAELFDFMARASHHLVFASVKISRGRAQQLSYLFRHTLWVSMLASSNTTEGLEENMPNFTPPFTWTYLGEGSEKKTASLKKMVADEVGEAEKVTVVARPMPLASMDGIVGGAAPVLSQVAEQYRVVARETLLGAAEKGRDFSLKSQLLFPYLKQVLNDVATNQVAPDVPDMKRLIANSMNERKSDAIKLFRQMVTSVLEGNRDWIEKVTQSSARPALLLDGLDYNEGQNGLVQEVRRLHAENTADGVSALSTSPASQAELLASIKEAWILSFSFFAEGFTSIDSDLASATRTDLRAELAKEKDTLKEAHIALIKEYLNQLTSLAIKAVQWYYVSQKIDDICSPEVEEATHSDLMLGVTALFDQPKAWWPPTTYESVTEATAVAKEAVTVMRDARLKKASGLIAAQMKEIADDRIKLAKEACVLPDDGTPAKQELHDICNNAVSSSLDFFDKSGDGISSGRCGGSWVRSHAEFVAAKRAMEASLVAMKDTVLKQNSELLLKKCQESVVEAVEEVATAFSAIEMQECPDEDALDRAAAEHLRAAPKIILTKWREWNGPVVTTCVADVATRIDEELQAVKGRVEHKLFGSDEVRVWRADWSDTLVESLAECTLCKFHSYFLLRHVTASAEASVPEMIAGNTVSPGFRAGLVAKAVRKEMSEKQYSAEYEMATYGVIAMIIGGVVFTLFV